MKYGFFFKSLLCTNSYSLTLLYDKYYWRQNEKNNIIFAFQQFYVVHWYGKKFTKQKGWRFECSNGYDITIMHEFFTENEILPSQYFLHSAIGSTATISGIFSIKQRLMPIFIVIIKLRQEPQAPCSFIRTSLPSISCNATFPPFANR